MDPRILAEQAGKHYVLQAVLGDMTAERASLDRAAELGAASISLPAISTVIFGYPKQEGVAAIVEEARLWLDGHPDSSPTTVRFTAFDELTAGLFADEIRVLATFMPKLGN